MASKINLTILQILEFVKVGLQNGNIEAAMVLLDDAITVLKEREKEKEKEKEKEYKGHQYDALDSEGLSGGKD